MTRRHARTALFTLLVFIVIACTWPSFSPTRASAVPAQTSAAEGADELLPSPPNILIINTDDQRYTETLEVMPRVSKFFVGGGTEYVNGAVTTALCCPSRASFFSGRYSHNNGITGNGLDELVANFDQDSTIQGYLQEAGYNTAIVGKYMNTYPLHRDPMNWTQWATTTGGYSDVPFNLNSEPRQTSGYYTKHLGNFATDFLQDFEAEDDKPWFMYVAPQAPHHPYRPQPKYATAEVPAVEKPPSWNEADISDKPQAVRNRAPVSEAEYIRKRTQMLRTLMSVDDMVQRLVRQMNLLGESENLLAVYMSDNGYLWGEHGVSEKRFPYLESIEVPFLLRWRGVLPEGETSARLVTQIDLLPTALEAAQATPTLTYPLDGQSILSAPPRTEVLHEYFKSPDSQMFPWAGIRTEEWQYVEWYDVTTGVIIWREYYDLVNDPYQMENVLRDGIDGNEPDVAPLHERLTDLRDCVGIECP